MAGATIIAPARAADVVSSNIVGYNKVTLNHELSILGANFKTVGAVNGETKISQIVPDANVTGIDWKGSWGWGASLLVWNGANYVGGMYYWTGEVPQAAQEEIKEELELDDDFVYNNIWVDGDMKPADPEMTVGNAFWIQDAAQPDKATKGTITTSGEVCTEDVAPAHPLYTGLTMVANTYPVTANISDVIPSNLSGIDWKGSWGWGASLLMWNGSDYVGGMYYWTGEVPQAAQEEIKEELELDEDVVYNNIWVDGDMMPANIQIPIGTGFWIQDNNATGESKITFVAP